MIESYSNSIFKALGLADKEVFTPEEFLPLVVEYPNFQGLYDATVSLSNLQLQLSTATDDTTKASLNSQIVTVQATITALKTQMGVK